jgi:anaerobic selenocysteine-containing dehydrogenase
LSRRKFLGMSGAGVLAASTGGWLLAPTAAEASPRSGPYDFATWEALAGERLTLRTASEQRTVLAHCPVKGVGRAYTVVLGHEGVMGDAKTLHDGTYELDHGRTGSFLLFVVSAGPGRYVATFNN